MIGTRLSDIRRHVESLASETGAYYLVCGRTGDRPVSVDGLYFESRPTARAAAQATTQYRATLRRYDPQLPHYDIIVCERPRDVPSPEDARRLSIASTDDTARRRVDPDRSLIEFCHTVAGTMFEAIADSSHTGVESAIMDTYLAVAETIEDPDDLCRCLLERIATELDARLDADEQAALLHAAAARLPPAPASDQGDADPFASTLQDLQTVALLETYTMHHCSIDLDSGTRSWTATLDGYALGRSAERIVILPVVVGLFRRLTTRSLTLTAAEPLARSSPPTWRLTLTTAADRSPGPLCVSEGHRS